MNETLEVIFGLIGGLAMFLYGMNGMSDALQKAAGEKMKKILALLTKNPVMGALAGALVTAVLQSSSATTVMAIGFVSAGLMTLPQAISVIFGANIGTTMTAQLMAFKISDYIYPIIFLGFMMNFVGKKEKIKNIGMVIFSFGLLFEGIEVMGSVMKPLAGSPVFVDLIGKVADIPILGLLLGAGMTLVVQSSSATIAVLQNFASQAGPDGVSSVLGLTGAIPVLLGDNIGTTITALIASIGQTKNAKRTAVAHSVFNITGSVVFLCVIPWFAKFVQFISPKGNEVDVISRQIANAHTTFNVVCTLVWLPLIPLMVKIVTWIIRGDDVKQIPDYAPQYLDDKMVGQPVAAMYLTSNEIRRLGGYAQEMIGSLRQIVEKEQAGEAVSSYNRTHGAVKELQDSVAAYITRLFGGGAMTEEQSEQTAGLLFISNHMSRIADRCQEVAETDQKLKSGGAKLSDKAREELGECVEIVEDLFAATMKAAEESDTSAAEQLSKEKNKMRKAQKRFTKAHLKRVEKKKCSPELTGVYSGMLYSMDRMMDSCIGIAEEIADHPAYVRLNEEEIQENFGGEVAHA